MSRTQRIVSRDVKAIGRRLIDMLTADFRLTMTQAAVHLGYANATTLHKVRRGFALPDPARLAGFAADQKILREHTMNLHWVWTGEGPRLISRGPTSTKRNYDDFINIVMQLGPDVKHAILVLLDRQKY